MLFLCLMPQIERICDISLWSYLNVVIYSLLKPEQQIHMAISLWDQIQTTFVVDADL